MKEGRGERGGARRRKGEEPEDKAKWKRRRQGCHVLWRGEEAKRVMKTLFLAPLQYMSELSSQLCTSLQGE